MNKSHITAILAVTTLAFSDGAIALDPSNSEHKTAGKKISADYQSDIKACDALVDKEKNICMAEAKRKERSARSKLKMRNKPANNLDNKMSDSPMSMQSPIKHSTLTVDHLRRP